MFAQEPGLAGTERLALDGVLSALHEHPVALKCTSAHITIVGPRPAGANQSGKPDIACLAAANQILVLTVLPGAAAPVRLAASRADAIINAHERHGKTFCVSP